MDGFSFNKTLSEQLAKNTARSGNPNGSTNKIEKSKWMCPAVDLKCSKPLTCERTSAKLVRRSLAHYLPVLNTFFNWPVM